MRVGRRRGAHRPDSGDRAAVSSSSSAAGTTSQPSQGQALAGVTPVGGDGAAEQRAEQGQHERAERMDGTARPAPASAARPGAAPAACAAQRERPGPAAAAWHRIGRARRRPCSAASSQQRRMRDRRPGDRPASARRVASSSVEQGDARSRRPARRALERARRRSASICDAGGREQPERGQADQQRLGERPRRGLVAAVAAPALHEERRRRSRRAPAIRPLNR